MQAAIEWPNGYLPGTTDNFCSNEVIVANISLAKTWEYLTDTRKWPTYYSNAKNIEFYDESGPLLNLGSRFKFTTFGFVVESRVVEFKPFKKGKAARLAWHGWVEGDEQERLDVHHAWILEELSENRLRILTQETQCGIPAQELAIAIPNPMINAHQEWLNGLVKAVQKVS
ncbi:hypothetical protein SAMN05216480_11819 [Pustulibacterium marinum]|uniref:Polyketide cyclase / dehydrase and lipid transport n=1 Tax=Pustulibacterium marinum TaxID=1224947 RepID=A0A1I7IMS2_9FLAO|nr:polyketide cyclase [Pustulibacterium marinum]SFU74218.1 hypothetical protein SAMN05216480_11819 [Pustulibacterium marinum]